MKVTAWVKKRFPARELAIGWTPDRFALHLRYDGECRMALEIPGSLSNPVAKLVAPWIGRDARTQEETLALYGLVPQLEKLGEPVTIFPDAEERIGQALHQRRLSALVAEIRKTPAAHPLRSSLLKTELLPYQLDGIAFAAGAGRAVLADEMGLGKTIQGVGVAEFLARQSGISRVLIVCPASLKSQWASEIGRFSGRSVGLVVGAQAERGAQYEGGPSSPSATTSRSSGIIFTSKGPPGTSSSWTRPSASKTGRRKPAA